jgi:hypothetical protein
MTGHGDVPMECLAVDWSGALTGAAERIWIGRATSGVLCSLDAPGSRAAVEQQLLERRREPAPCLVGLDFAFGLPAWYARSSGWRTIDDVWRAARNYGARWLAECPPPFWGRPGRRRDHAAALGLRETERTWAGSAQPKSVFQIGGAGSVGTGSVRGMPMLIALHEAGWSVWPFHPPSSHTLVEIYPRLFTGPVVKSSPMARSAWLERHGGAVPQAFRAVMERSEDAFDAGISARPSVRARK